MARVTAGFISYVHEVDAQGDVGRFRAALEQAIGEHGREDFRIFQDRNDIQWGDDWKERVTNSFEDTIFLIPIISPRLFRSEACRFEISAFFERQQHLDDIPLLLPVYFVTTPEYEANAATKDDLVLKLRQAHTHLDWRQLRMLPESDPAYRKQIMQAAERIARLIDRIETRASPIEVRPPPPVPPSDGPEAKRLPRYWGLWAAAVPAVGIVTFILLARPDREPLPQKPPEEVSRPISPPIIEQPAPPAARQEPTLEALDRSCIVQEHLDSRRRPDTSAGWGPHLSPGQQVQLIGKVMGSDWVAAKGSDGTVFYLNGQACSG